MAIFGKIETKKVEETKKGEFDPATFMKTFESTMTKFAQAQQQGFNTLAQQLASGGKPAPKEEPKRETITDESIDKMTNSQLMKHLLAQVSEVVKAGVQPVQEAVEQTSTRVDQTDVKAQFDKLKAAHPELNHFREQMKQVLTEHPDLVNNLERALILAKAEAPEIVAKLAEENKTKEDEKGQEEKQPFGGFFPAPMRLTSKEDNSKDGDGNPKEVRDVLSDTFDLVMKDVPAGAFH